MYYQHMSSHISRLAWTDTAYHNMRLFELKHECISLSNDKPKTLPDVRGTVCEFVAKWVAIEADLFDVQLSKNIQLSFQFYLSQHKHTN